MENFEIPKEKKNDYSWILQNRIFRIFNVITEYGEENFYLSFSGGKDSTVLSSLVDMAVPGNKIPRVYADTGIELNIIRDFVLKLAKKDDRVTIIKPSVPIKKMLEQEGYPFKSKKHSGLLATYQKNKTLEGMDGLLHYLSEHPDGKVYAAMSRCPNILRYQFTDDFDLKISDKCCKRLKKDPLKLWQAENNKPYGIIGLMREEGGNRSKASCIAFKSNGKMNFQPLVPLTKEWEEWFIEKYNIEICDIYKPPYNFPRTGCKGCPFIVNLQEQLDILQKYFPQERKQCEAIWKPVYDEYRRIGYRLNKEEQLAFSDDDFIRPKTDR